MTNQLAKAVGVGAATVIVAATSAEIAAGAGVVEAVSNGGTQGDGSPVSAVSKNKATLY